MPFHYRARSTRGLETMPTYDYYCKECGHSKEAFHKMSDPPLSFCEKCQKETLQRRPGNRAGNGAGLLLSGDGFYATMYGDDHPPKKSAGGCCPCGKNQGSCST